MSERTVEQALAHAEWCRNNTSQTGRNGLLVLLADEVARLRAEVEHLKYYEMIHKEKE